ncbi:hypothetical protein NW768_012026 [Fusarium equiseti]|uniref:Uncharacterized protein n=1 Tax=Fusarium equiseti TaxID=61235 RepID=A0ABQ8QVX0_FUSEQ|nr:hypothetical protein NW768_012026 [Fusarium equiseti]
MSTDSDESSESESESIEEPTPYFYNFLTTLHFDEKDLKVPPPEGWPHLTPEFCRHFKADHTIEVLRHLPYFDQRTKVNIHRGSTLLDYTSFTREDFENAVDARRHEIIHVTDRAGRPARILWLRKPTELLLPLASICFYFVHPNLNLDDFSFQKFRDDVLHNANEQLRADIFFIPGGTDDDCVEHYRREVESRGDVLEQIRDVQEAYKDFYNNHGYIHEERKERLPGLFASHKGESSGYHGLIFVFKKPAWELEDDDKKLDMVQFDPELTLEDFEPWERIPTLAPIKARQVRARSESFDFGNDPVYKGSEDQSVWWWFFDLRSGRLWDGAMQARTTAKDLGWMSW